MTILLRQKSLPQVVRQIVQRDNGAWFDPEDLSTMFQDAAGTTPVTALEQPVGLMLDKARGMMLGPELVSNGSFDTDAGSWAPIASGVTNYTIDSGTVIVTTNAASGLTQMVPTEVGKFYRATVKLKSISGVSGSCRVDAPFGTIVAQTALSSSLESTTVQVIFKATSSQTTIYLRVSSAGTFSFDEVSTRELYGYHATQSITASRPTLSARKNLLVATDVLSTQTVTTVAAKYCLSFWGTGVITLSGTATGTLVGTGTESRVWIEITPTAGTLTLTVSGSVLKAQLEFTS